MTLQTDFNQYMEKLGLKKQPVSNYIEIAVTTDTTQPYGRNITWEEVGCIGTTVSSDQILPKIRANAKPRKRQELIDNAKSRASEILVKSMLGDNIPSISFIPYPFNNRQYFLQDKNIGKIGGIVVNDKIGLEKMSKSCYIMPRFKDDFQTIVK